MGNMLVQQGKTGNFLQSHGCMQKHLRLDKALQQSRFSLLHLQSHTAVDFFAALGMQHIEILKTAPKMP